MRLHGPGRVIDRPEQLSAAVVSDLLAETGRLPSGARVDRISVEPVGTGQMADTVRIRLEGEGVPATLVAKFASSDETSRATGKMMRAYEVEVSFYAELAERERLCRATLRGMAAMLAAHAHLCVRPPAGRSPGRRAQAWGWLH